MNQSILIVHNFIATVKVITNNERVQSWKPIHIRNWSIGQFQQVQHELEKFPWICMYIQIHGNSTFFPSNQRFCHKQCTVRPLTLFWQKFCESNGFTKKLLNSWFDEIFHIAQNCKNEKFTATRFFSSNQFIVMHNGLVLVKR